MNSRSYMKQFLNNLKYKNFIIISSLLAFATLVYCLGFTYIFLPIALMYIISIYPTSKVFNSIVTKITPSILIFFGLYQMVATLQQFFFRYTGFTTIAIIITALLILLGYLKTYYVDKKDITLKMRLVSSNDLTVLFAVLIFIVPFSAFLLKGGDMYQNSAQVGGIQAIDGTNHWNQIYVNSFSESIRYDRNSYFPAGFHIATAFVQDSIGLNPNKVSDWKLNSLMFMLQYVIAAVSLIVVSVFFILKLLGDRPSKWQKSILVVSLVPSLIALFIIPFIYNGFLNHIYMCSAVILAAILLIEWCEVVKSKKNPKLLSSYLLGAYYIVAYGAVLSWPLIGPPLILAPLLLGVPSISLRLLKSKIERQHLIGILIGSLVLSVPVLIQYFVSPIGPTASILLEGGLKIWHVGLYGLFALTGIWIYSQKNKMPALRPVLIFIVSFLILVIFLAALQSFAIGQVRYYTIKTSSFIEIFILLVLTFVVVVEMGKSKTIVSFIVAAVAVPTLMFVAISFNDNPLKDMRSLFRTYSHEQKPPFFDEDIRAMTSIAEEGKTFWSNYMTLHYNFEAGKIYTHTQIPFWVSTIRKDVVAGDEATTCLRKVYEVMLFSDYSEKSQADLRYNIDKCSNVANKNRQKYYILTDAASNDIIRKMFSTSPNIEIITE